MTRYAVLDDENDGLDSLPLFQPSSLTGLTDEIAQGLVDYLNGKIDLDMRSSRMVRWLLDFLDALATAVCINCAVWSPIKPLSCPVIALRAAS